MRGVRRADRHTWFEEQVRRAAHASAAQVSELLPFLESDNPAMTRAIATARQAAASDVPILLVGECGTGKRALAGAIHDWSHRRSHGFVTVSQATIAKQFWATIIRQTRGDRGGEVDQQLEVVDGSTAFFDEVGDLSVEVQGQLLRFFDEGRFWWIAQGANGEATKVDLRIVAATSCDLEASVRAGRFRADLFSRLNAITIPVPPLRERGEDLAKLSDHVLAALALRYQRGRLTIAPDARAALSRYRWPRNVRELADVLEWAVVLAHGDVITTAELPEQVVASGAVAAETSSVPVMSLHDLARRWIEPAIGESATVETPDATLGRRGKRYRLH